MSGSSSGGNLLGRRSSEAVDKHKKKLLRIVHKQIIKLHQKRPHLPGDTLFDDDSSGEGSSNHDNPNDPTGSISMNSRSVPQNDGLLGEDQEEFDPSTSNSDEQTDIRHSLADELNVPLSSSSSINEQNRPRLSPTNGPRQSQTSSPKSPSQSLALSPNGPGSQSQASSPKSPSQSLALSPNGPGSQSQALSPKSQSQSQASSPKSQSQSQALSLNDPSRTQSSSPNSTSQSPALSPNGPSRTQSSSPKSTNQSQALSPKSTSQSQASSPNGPSRTQSWSPKGPSQTQASSPNTSESGRSFPTGQGPSQGSLSDDVTGRRISVNKEDSTSNKLPTEKESRDEADTSSAAESHPPSPSDSNTIHPSSTNHRPQGQSSFLKSQSQDEALNPNSRTENPNPNRQSQDKSKTLSPNGRNTKDPMSPNSRSEDQNFSPKGQLESPGNFSSPNEGNKLGDPLDTASGEQDPLSKESHRGSLGAQEGNMGQSIPPPSPDSSRHSVEERRWSISPTASQGSIGSGLNPFMIFIPMIFLVLLILLVYLVGYSKDERNVEEPCYDDISKGPVV